MLHDVWFTRAGSGKHVWFVWCEPGEPPIRMPSRARNVKEAFKFLKKAGIRYGQVGIADRDTLGLE